MVDGAGVEGDAEAVAAASRGGCCRSGSVAFAECVNILVVASTAVLR